jgi:ParB family chromosome partitioning protein
VLSLPIEKVRPNHLQPRKHFDAEKLSELASSIKTHGLAQPILVSFDAASQTYELIAGERRLRASELAGLTEIPAIVRAPESDKSRLSIALIENLQREDLNPIESALGYLRLMKEFQISQTDLGGIIGKSKSALSNTLRLLELPEDMQKALEFGHLSEGHGRALLMTEDRLHRNRIFALAMSQKLSVREVEDLARQANAGTLPTNEGKPAKAARVKPADIRSLENELQHALGTKIEIKTKKDPTKGAITIHFFSLDDFEKIVKLLKK